MAKLLTILVLALVLEAMGVVLLSKGLKQIGEPKKISVAEIARVVKLGLSNPSLLLGVALEAVFFGALIYLLSQRDVSLIWPLTSLGFVITTVAARFILHEQISWVRWSGVALIVIGAGFISYSEVMKKQPPDPEPAASGSSAAR